MGYPDNILAAGEQVVIHRHPHLKMLAAPIAGLFAISTLAGVALGYVGASQLSADSAMALRLVIVVLWLLIVVWLVIRPVLAWRTTHFVITDRRVTFRRGILSRSGIDVPLQRINSVEFRRSLTDRLFRTGTLVIESASQEPLAFTAIPDVKSVHALLYHEVFDRREVYSPHPQWIDDSRS